MKHRKKLTSEVSGTKKLGFQVSTKPGLIFAFVLLQFYFVCTFLSFAIWDASGFINFLHILIYFGGWIIVLTACLGVFLRYANVGKRPRTTMLVLAVLTLPMFGLWLQIYRLDPRWLEYVIVLLFPVAVYVYYRLSMSHIKKMRILMLGLCTVSLFTHAEWEQFTSKSLSLEKYSETVLKRRPNIHIVMFDGFTTSEYATEFLDTHNPASDYLSGSNNAIFAGNRGFAEAVPTRKAWNTVFHLGSFIPPPFNKIAGVFSGQRSSPLTSLLRNNGYKIQTGFNSAYLGREKGAYIDTYHMEVPKWASFKRMVCTEKLLGFCSDFSGKLYTFLELLLNKQLFKTVENEVWRETVVKLIKEFEYNNISPVFSAFHIYLPGHWPNGVTLSVETLKDYREDFISGNLDVLKTLHAIETLRTEFPESIFIISGDHGPFLSNGMTNVDDQRFKTLDTHHISVALLNESNLCQFQRNWLNQQPFLSPTRMLLAALTCDGDNMHLLENLPNHPDFIQDSIF